jgi:hypothetical protein
MGWKGLSFHTSIVLVRWLGYHSFWKVPSEHSVAMLCCYGLGCHGLLLGPLGMFCCQGLLLWPWLPWFVAKAFGNVLLRCYTAHMYW